MVTDSAGNIKSESDYYPWGDELQFTNADSNHYKFTGKERDSETGLDYFGARYYSNGLGRFITPDWAAKATAVPYADFADPQSLNLYTYVRNVPTTKRDPDGHNWLTDQFKKAAVGALKGLGFVALAPAPPNPMSQPPLLHTTGERIQGQIEQAQRQTSVPEIVIPHGATEKLFFSATVAALLVSGLEEEVQAGRAALGRALASEAQTAELLAGQGRTIAGSGTKTVLRDAPRLAAEHGGAPGDWAKITSSHYTPSGSTGAQTGFETHAYQNLKTGQIVEMKTVPDQIHNVKP